ncbi:uncharacterized protein LOC110860489 isoform X2 [Folsomia candida]|uniref:uncharacterized protein LOC110860489 isoform X2 n=1 Tax=Folsomia candida TaxID=158441 RepID=UPI001604C233|nr:uncharacterized protein LOC110860489 isoform X2 [Folsomia candida]
MCEKFDKHLHNNHGILNAVTRTKQLNVRMHLLHFKSMAGKRMPVSSRMLHYLFLNLCLTVVVLVPDNANAKGTCKVGEFRCETGECIPKDQVCDSNRDCPSGLDEYVCTPKFRRGLCGRGLPKRTGIFQCQFGGCIPLNRLCDGNVNCIGGSDESQICENNSCLPGQFRCKYGACIADWQLCNGRVNCPDGSDETPEACKHITCKSNEFRCRYGGCIPKDRICDIKKHCADGSDEYDFLCLITRAKMVERWGAESKLINQEQDQRFLAVAEKERKRKEEREAAEKLTTTTTTTTTTTPPTTTTRRPVPIYDNTIPTFPATEQEGEELTYPTENPPLQDDTPKVVATIPTSAAADDDEDDNVPLKQDESAEKVPNPSPSSVVQDQNHDEELASLHRECLLPAIPDNSEASISSCLSNPFAHFCRDSSKTVPVGVIIQYECGAGYLLYGPQAITCQSDGSWSARPPECDPLIDVRFGFGSALPNNFDPRCPPLTPSKGVSVECIDPENVAVKPCSEKQTAGTEARFTCAPYHRPSSDLPTHYEKCGEDGTWGPGSYEQFSCSPDCGLLEVPKTPYILNGVSTRRGQWPWHVAIYLKHKGEFKYICGGALISDKAVLTSAHCVTLRGEARNASDFLVLLGKQNIVLPDPDPFVQKRSVSKIMVEESFNYRALDSDLAIVSLTTPAVLTFHVRPVCYPQTSNSFLEEYQLAAGSIGTVVGFGLTENGSLSNSLKMAQLPVVSVTECASSHGDFFASMTRSTNYCAGYRNGTQVCNGDSGGGQYFRANVKGSTRWYVQGLISFGVPDSKAGTCSSSQYAIFTRVGRYGDWIVRTLSRENLI